MKRWIIPETNAGTVAMLCNQLNIEPILAAVLVQRGIASEEAADRFFHPSIAYLHDPFLLRDMDVAVQRLNAAMQQDERILLYGDYDVDGTTSVALMFAFLRSFYKNLDYYLPDRDKEGYGVSIAGVEYARETGCSLVIAMDCGIKAQAEVALAASYGIDFIICDHHLPEGGLPAAVAILDPKRTDCPYPNKELSGCGITFKLAQAFALYHNTPAEELVGLLDFVALSIACDIVPMDGENRILAYHGLKKLNMAPRLGLWALINKSNRSYPLNINDLVFGLGPLINAAGRLGDARDSVKLMLSTDRNSALEAAGHLLLRNKERQQVDLSATTSARLRAKADHLDNGNKSIVLFDASWHKGIIGITASRLSEDFHKPTVIITESEGRAVGSARSVPGFDLYAALHSCGDFFHSFGGHAHAAGFQMPLEKVAAFAEKFEMIVRQNMTDEAQQPILNICGEIQFDQITPEFWQSLKRFEPFGPMNMNPIFAAYGVRDSGKSRRLDNNHVRLSLQQGNTTFSAVGFGLADAFEKVKGRPFDIAFNLREEQWQGQTMVSLMIKDVR
jgi:single-stranded-DNA-specific exonuclease